MTTPAQFISADPRLVGANAIVQLDNNQWALSCDVTRRLIIAWQGPYVGYSDTGDIGSEPGCIMLLDDLLWTVCADGTVRSFTDDTPPVQQSSTDVDAATNSWITSSGSVVVAPGPQGGVVSLSSAGAVLASYDQVGLSEIAFAIASGGYLYCFDGFGDGVILSVNGSTGAFAFIGWFQAQDCEGPLSGFAVSSVLYLAVQARAAVVTFSLVAPTAPVQTSRATYDLPLSIEGTTPVIHGVLNDSAHTPMTDVPQSAVGLATWWEAFAGFTDGTNALIAFGLAGRLGWTTTQSPPFHVRILLEAGVGLLQQEDDASNLLCQGRPV